MSLVGAITSGGTRASRSASASTSSTSRSAGTTRLTSPIRWASTAVDEVAGQQQLAGLLLADEVRHEQGHRRRPEPDLGLTELGVVGRHDEVAGHRQLEAAGQRIAVDLGDDGLGAAPDGSVAATSRGQHATPAPGVVRLLLGQVVAGAERPAGAVDDDDPDGIVGDGRRDRLGQGLAQLVADGVELGRPVEREPDAPRRRRRQAGPARRSSSRRPGPPARPAHRPRWRPSGAAMTGLRSTSSTSGRSMPSRPSATSIVASAARSTGGRPRTPSQQPAPREDRRASPPRSAGRAGRAGRRHRRGDRSGRHRGRRARQGPNCGSRRRPTISSRPGRRHRLDEQAADRQAVPARPSRAGRARRRRRHRRRGVRARRRRHRSCG